MAHFVFVTWDGGGNVSVVLGIGRALLERSHEATVLAPISLRQQIEEVVLGHGEFGSPRPREVNAALEHLLEEVVGSPTMAEDLGRAADDLGADALVIDCNLSAALEVRTQLPVAVLVHTAFGLYLPPWQAVVASANDRRVKRGLHPLAAPAESWPSRDRVLITSLADFDRPPMPFPPNARYVGPVRSPVAASTPMSISVGAPGKPLVLVSYSTHPLLNQPERIQTALDALADLPVQVVATTSGAFDSAQLRLPGNAVVFDYVPHAQLMPEASLVIGHAGHGTTMEALCHGVPLVCVPGLGRDQSAIAARVKELGLGIGLADGATSTDIRTAAARILSDSSYLARTREFRDRCGRVDGAGTAAAELEALVTGAGA